MAPKFNSGSRDRAYKSAVFSFALGAALLVLLGVASLGAGGVSAQSTSGQQAQQTQRYPLNSWVVTTYNANLRDQPSGGSDVLTVMPMNTRLLIMGGPFYGEWYWVNYKDKWGFVSNTVISQPGAKPTPAASGTATATPGKIATPPASVETALAATPSVTATQAVTQSNYSGLWLGEMSDGGNVRSGPGLDQKIVKQWWAGRRVLLYQAVKDKTGATWYRVSEPPEDPLYVHSSLITKIAPVKFETALHKGKWVNVNLTQQIVTAYEGSKPVMVTLASTGTAKNPTTIGVWQIYWRLPKQEMKGGNLASEDYYDLKDVPYVQYFQVSGEALHGTYWHDDFGHPHSHGCVNLSTPIAKWFYDWASLGTIVDVHN